MHIIAIGWLWVAFMMAITQKTIVSGISTFIFYGVLPCALLVYLLTTPTRRKRHAQREAEKARDQVNVQPPVSATSDTSSQP